MKNLMVIAAMLLVVTAAGAYTIDEISEKVVAAFDQETGTFADGAYDCLIDAHGMIGETLSENPDEASVIAALISLDVAVTYNLGCLDALDGNTDEALEWLQAAVDAGYNDPDWMEQDPDLESLHGDSRFQILLDGAAENDCGASAGCSSGGCGGCGGGSGNCGD